MSAPTVPATPGLESGFALPARIAFDPALPVWVIALLAGLMALGLGLYVWRGGTAAISRGLGLGLIVLGLLQPLGVREVRQPSKDIVALVVDQSESMALAGRTQAARDSADALRTRLAQDTSLEVRVREVRSDAQGTPLIAALEDSLADAPRDRIAGAILITDGQAADAPADPARLKPLGPIHAVIMGDPARGDRRLELLAAPGFGIVGEPVRIEAFVHDPVKGAMARLTVSADGRVLRTVDARAGEPIALTIPTPRRGDSMILVDVAPGPSEISLANNRQAFKLSGLRDRLRVLLVTGEPHPGARVWRNLLKSDPGVDLVHFTILRPQDKSDFTPLSELALIAFPTRELFVDKLDEFDLIIFDRYRRRALLRGEYFENIARRVEAGGALLIAAGPYDGSGESLYDTPLAAVLPSAPTGRVVAQAYRPQRTGLGERHPVTRGLPNPEAWGRWERLIEANAPRGRVVMTGPGERPLLVLDRVGQGRVAQLWSDQVWLWARGYDGGGPHGELLRRLAHWLMGEPDLDEERLTLRATTVGLTAEFATLGEAPGAGALIGPTGARQTAAFSAAGPGLYRAVFPTRTEGLYEIRLGRLTAFAALGPANPKEAAALTATDTILAATLSASGGVAVFAGEDGARFPEVRRVGANEAAAGAGWLGLKRREAYTVSAAAAQPLGPGLAWALAGFLLLLFSWRREAR
jgi:hypothetical protein